MNWRKLTVPPEKVLKKIKPGNRIFLGTGAAEPRTVVKHLMLSREKNLVDLELIQLVSFNKALSLKELRSQKYRLKTFFSGWVSAQAITEGRIDMVPCRFARIPHLFEERKISIDVAVVQITPPDESGYCSLGIAHDVGRLAMEQASLVVGEFNAHIPRTFGDTFVHVSDFDIFVQSSEPPFYFPRWHVDEVFDKIAANIASVIEDRSCLAFSIGPLFEALSVHLAGKRHLGIHSPFFTDAVMDLVKSGAVTNRYKRIFQGKCLSSYALGTPELMTWLDNNPLVEFQGVGKVFSPAFIRENPRFVAVQPARKVDLSGRVVLQTGKGNVGTGPAEIIDFFHGAEISEHGRTIFALPSRNRRGEPNIKINVGRFLNQFPLKESIDMVITEFGVAALCGRSVRERAQSLIDVAHPDDRPELIEQAKKRKILYHDQIFLSGSAHLYPGYIAAKQTFKGNLTVRFRAIRPSDEEEMRRLFYRFSDESVYERYLSIVKSMPHSKMQEYVNVDWSQVVSVVALVGDLGMGHLIGEGRFIKQRTRPYAEVAFVVDEEYQSLGIATYLYSLLVNEARKRDICGFTADVLFRNIAMMKVFRKGNLPVKAKLENGIYQLEIPFDERI